MWQAPSLAASPLLSVTNSSVLAGTQSVAVLIRESGVEVEGKLEVLELRLSASLLHFRGFDGTMARLCGFEFEKLSTLSGLLCNPSFDT